MTNRGGGPSGPGAMRASTTLAIGQPFILVGAVAIIVSIFLKWEDLSLGSRHETAKAKNIPVQFLWDYTTHSKDPSLVLILAISAALCLVGAVLALRLAALIGGLLGAFTGVMYGFQVHQALHGLGLARIHTTDFVGIAPWIAAGGGALAVLGAVLPLRR